MKTGTTGAVVPIFIVQDPPSLFVSRGSGSPGLDENRYDRCGRTNFHCPGPSDPPPLVLPLARALRALAPGSAGPGPWAERAWPSLPFPSQRIAVLAFWHLPGSGMDLACGLGRCLGESMWIAHGVGYSCVVGMPATG